MSTEFFNFISKSIINSLSERLSKQLNIQVEYIKKALIDENFKLNETTCTIKNEVRIDIDNESEETLAEVRIDIKNNENDKTNKYNVSPLDKSIYIYDFTDLTYQDSETFWKHKRIKIDNIYYRLHLSTNLILDPRKDGTLLLIGMKNKENECMDLDELDSIVFKWCDVHSIKY
jgi:hypothetical protein